MSQFDVEARNSTSKPRIYRGWDLVPRNFCTRNGWKRRGRTVQRGEKSAAVVQVENKPSAGDPGTEHCTTCKFWLYHFNQTKPARKTALNSARRMYYGIFVRNSDRTRLIRWTKGEYRVDDNQIY